MFYIEIFFSTDLAPTFTITWDFQSTYDSLKVQ